MNTKLFEIAELIGEGSFRTAIEKFNYYVPELGKLNVQEKIFVNALSKKLDTKYSENSNLYLSDYSNAQIDIFDTLANLPILTYSYRIANQIIVDSIMESKLIDVAIADIGIGKGMQMFSLIKEIARQHGSLQKLTIIGIEPASSLWEAKEMIERLSGEVNFELKFLGLQKSIEQLSENDWEILHAFKGRIIVSEAYALHHIVSPGGKDERSRVLSQLKSLDPLSLVMIEPNSDHNIEDFSNRFKNCWDHFGLVFRMLDRLGIPTETSNALKEEFWGREIEDIISKDIPSNRHERHESVMSWLNRLNTSGFDLEENWRKIKETEDPVFSFSCNRGYVGIDFEGATIVAIITGK